MMVTEGPLPRAFEAEREVLGACLIDPSVIPEVSSLLATTDFTDRRHEVLFECLKALDRDAVVPEPVVIRSWLESSGHIGDGMSWDAWIRVLSTLAEGYGTTANARWYCDMVRGATVRRAIVCAARSAEKLAWSQELSVADVAEQVDSLMVGATSRYDQDERLGLVGTGISNTVKAVEEASRSQKPIGLMTGWASLDEHIGGIGPDELWVLAGQTSMGKTSLALQLACRVAARGLPAVYFTVEMKKQPRIHHRLLSMRARVPIVDMKRGRLSPEQWSRMNEAADWVHRLPLYIDDSAALTLDRVRAVSRYLAKRQRLALVVVDYLQLMVARTTARLSRNDALGEITRGLKVLAQDVVGCPVLLLSQLNRSLEYEHRKSSWKRKPRCSDLRDSGNIEQDADAVAFIIERHDKNDMLHNAELWFDKLRDGQRRVGVPLKWVPEYVRFDD